MEDLKHFMGTFHNELLDGNGNAFFIPEVLD
jgi:hypothetical protein